MPESISARADRLFEAARAALRQDANAILAEHSASGCLRSGATIIRVTETLAQRSREALYEKRPHVEDVNDFAHRGALVRVAVEHALKLPIESPIVPPIDGRRDEARVELPLDIQVIEKLAEHERNQLFAVAELRLLGLFEPSIDE